MHLKGFNCQRNTSQSTAKRPPELPPTLEMDAQSSPREPGMEPGMEPEEPHGSPKSRKGIPKGCQTRSKAAHFASKWPKDLQNTSQNETQKELFSRPPQYAYFERSPLRNQRLWESKASAKPPRTQPKSMMATGKLPGGLWRSDGGAMEQLRRSPDGPGGSQKALRLYPVSPPCPPCMVFVIPKVILEANS